MQKPFVFIITILLMQWGHSQIENVQETLRIKATEIAEKDKNTPSLINVSPVKGLTNKDFKIRNYIKRIPKQLRLIN